MKNKKPIPPMQQLAAQLFGKIKDKSEAKQMLQELYKYGIESMLKAELDEHLNQEEQQDFTEKNYRNGNSVKTVKSSIGDLALNIPRDRNITFSPMFVPKHSRMIDNIEDVVIGLYARGMNTRDIEDQIKDIYQIEISETTFSNINSRVIEYMKLWQNRPLEKVYFSVWMDAISIKVKDNGKINNKSIY